MRSDLAEREAENTNEGELINLFLEGIEGFDQMPEEEIRKMWTALFG